MQDIKVSESVFVIDADVTTLKQAAAVLRPEGYRVSLFTSAEQALTSLETSRTEVVVLNPKLPGMSGLELAVRLKQNSRTSNTIVIALMASASSDARKVAFAAGCDDYVVKPVDHQALIRVVRGALHPELEAPAPRNGGSGVFCSNSPEFEDLRRSYLGDGERKCRALLDSMGYGFDGAAAHEVARNMAGAGELLGLQDIAEAARQLSAVLGCYPYDRAKLRERLDLLIRAFAAEAGPAPKIPEQFSACLRGKHIALIGFASPEDERICAALECAGALPRFFDINQPLESDVVRNCAIILLHVREETKSCASLKALSGIGKPLILVGRGADLTSLDETVQTCAREFLIDGWRQEEVAMRLGLVLSRNTARPSTTAKAAAPVASVRAKTHDVLIVDDDLSMRALVRTILERQGTRCLLAANGEEGLALVREHHPGTVILDVNMPGMSGFEVLPRLRAQTPETKILMLTANGCEADVVRGFDLGADDYVSKPFQPLELAARVKMLL